ncbi:MAG: hypothetical protein ABIT01_09320 [Thermoanaerobaculia bacterium]
MSPLARFKAYVKSVLAASGPYFQSATVDQILLRQELSALREQLRAVTPDNVALWGHKIYSQTDEDGIISEIFRRIGEGSRSFVEIGCGNGSENNTHALLLKGWRGTWIDGSSKNVEHMARWIPLESPRLHVVRAFVTRENAPGMVSSALARAKAPELDLLSVDIDGNDLYVLQAILLAVRPRVIVAEYNGKFPPPLALSIEYDPAHTWALDDYHGASLQSLVDHLAGYRLVSCNLSGSNGFFIREDLSSAFAPYPVEALFQPARVHLIRERIGQLASLKFLRDSLRQ